MSLNLKNIANQILIVLTSNSEFQFEYWILENKNTNVDSKAKDDISKLHTMPKHCNYQILF